MQCVTDRLWTDEQTEYLAYINIAYTLCLCALKIRPTKAIQ